MAVPLLTPTRCVLLIGDEALYIYDVSFRAANLVSEISWQTDDFEETVSDLIRKECRGKPVLILNDMTDQHFKGGQRMPKVSPLDKMNVVKRKLQVAFPNYPIRGALKIKPVRNRGRGPAAGKKEGGLYLFAAVPMSDPVGKTIRAVQSSMASITGFYLLPVEAAGMVQEVAKKAAGRKRKPARWVIFIGQHRGNTLRQVITRDGQLAMTRMTPLPDMEQASPEAWARDVNQEFRATISYLSRFGFAAEEGVDVIVIGGRESGEALRAMIDLPCHYVSMTAQEAARELGVGIGLRADPALADTLYAAWIGRGNAFMLPMHAPDLERVHKPRQIATAAILLMVLGGGWQGWQMMSGLQTMMTAQDDRETQRRALAQASADYDQEVEHMKQMGFDVKLVQGAIGVFDDLETRRMHPLPLVQKIGAALQGQLRLDELNMNYISHKDDAPAFDPATGLEVKAKPEVEVTLKLSFPPTIEPEIGVREIENLRRRLSDLLPGYKVDIMKNVAGYEYGDSLSGTAGRSAEQLASEQRVAVIKLAGPVQ